MDDMKRNLSIEGEPFEFSKAYPGVGEQDPVQIPGGIRSLTFTLTPVGGTSKIQATTSPEEEILSGVATWQDHPDGAVGAQLQDWLQPVSAVRVVVITGTAKLSMRGQ